MFNNKISQNNNHFQFIDDTEECLTISLSSEEIDRAKPGKQDYSNDEARHNALINYVAVNAISRWLQEITSEEVNIWEEDTLHTIWEVVNGTAIELGGKRIILIPREDLDTEEFLVPAEWIKIHDWRGDYYLAIQVNLEDMWLRVWGCTTHKQIVQMAEYDARWRNYCLGGEELVSDIDVMLVARKYDAVNKLAVDPLPSLTSSQVDRLIAELAKPCSFSCRYKVDIDQWCGLISNSNSLKELYEARVQLVRYYQKNVVKKSQVDPITDLAKLLVGYWQNGWQDSATLVPQNCMSVKKDVAKKIVLGENQVLLCLEMSMPAHNKLEILIKVLAFNSDNLPHGLQIDILDEFNEIYWTRTIDNISLPGIQKKFGFNWQENFSIRFTLGEIFKEEKFSIDNE